jgi:hypothetical protein
MVATGRSGMPANEPIRRKVHEARHAFQDAYQADEEARAIFESAKPAYDRIIAAQVENHLPDQADLLLLEAYYRQVEIATSKGLRFLALARQSDLLRNQTRYQPAAPPLAGSQVKKEGIEVMKVALRVLTAVTEKSEPDASDVDALAAFAPDLTALPPDELACEVIQRAMKRQVHMQRALIGT